MPAETFTRARSVRQLAQYWAVSPRKIRALIRRGLLRAIDLGANGRQQLRITPEAVTECERLLTVGKLPPKRQRIKGIDPEIEALLN
jgi:hypothetical protein